jgi:hypothetical protein
MKNRSPVYHLVHQEIKACATHLLEMGQDWEFSQEKEAVHALSRLAELHTFATRVRPDSLYHPLCELKDYLENTMLKYQDGQNRILTMRLSEVALLLGLHVEPDSSAGDLEAAVREDLKQHGLMQSSPRPPETHLGKTPESPASFIPNFDDPAVRSLTRYFIRHFQEEIKPGRPLFRKLVEIKKI